MGVNAYALGLCEVKSGWTGYLAVTIGSLVAVARPSPVTSVAELMTALARAAAAKHGGAWRAYPDAVGLLRIEGPSAFTLTGAGTAQSRTAFTSTYTGATEYASASSPHDGGRYALLGAGGFLDGAEPGATTKGVPLGAGDQVLHAIRGTTEGEIRAESYLNTEFADWQSDVVGDGTFDLWFGGRVLSRVRLGGARFERKAMGGTSTRAIFVARVTEVSL